MRILVVSDREYKKTTRGIDIITTFFAENNCLVDHLVFFKREKFPEKQISENIRQLYFFDSLKLYRSRIQFLFPGFLLLLYFRYIIRNQTSVDFSIYDYVVLESGHPIYLALEIENKIIYRQSDATEISFNSNRRFYTKLEMNTIRKACIVSSALQRIYYPKLYIFKFNYTHSGYLPVNNKIRTIKDKSFVYLGGGKLDWNLIIKICKKYPDYMFHIVGNFRKFTSLKNIIFHGYIDHSIYQEICLNSDVCIIPYSKQFAYQLRRCYFSAKVLFPMSLGIPIIMKNYGVIQNTDYDKKLFVYNTHKEALNLLKNIINKIELGEIKREVSKNTQEFLFPQTVEKRLKELDNVFLHVLNWT